MTTTQQCYWLLKNGKERIKKSKSKEKRRAFVRKTEMFINKSKPPKIIENC